MDRSENIRLLGGGGAAAVGLAVPLLSVSTTVAAAVLVAMALVILVIAGLRRSARWLFPFANGVAGLALAIQAVGLCPTACGALGRFAYLGPAPVLWIGLAAHGLLALVGLLLLRRAADRFPIAYVIGLALGQGASLYFLGVLLVHRLACPTCLTVHLLMAVQLIALVRTVPRQQWIAIAAALAFAVLGLGLVHRYVTPAAPGMHQDRMEQILAGEPEREQVAEGVSAVEAEPSGHRPPSANPSEPVASRIAHPNQWGDGAAPILVRAHMRFICPICRQHWSDLREELLAAFVENGDIQVAVMLSWPEHPQQHHGARVAVLACYTMGLFGEAALLSAVDACFDPAGQALIESIEAETSEHAATAPGGTEAALMRMFNHLDAIVPQARSAAAWRRHGPALERRLEAEASWIRRYGSPGTPRYYFLQADQPAGPPYQDTSKPSEPVLRSFIRRGLR